MTGNKLDALFQNQKLARAFAEAETPEAAAALLREEQIEIPLEQVKQAKMFLDKIKSGELDPKQYLNESGELKAELTPEELENVAGGTTPLGFLAAIPAAVATILSVALS